MYCVATNLCTASASASSDEYIVSYNTETEAVLALIKTGFFEYPWIENKDINTPIEVKEVAVTGN